MNLLQTTLECHFTLARRPDTRPAAIVFIVFLLPMAVTVHGQIVLDDGGTHTIDENIDSERIQILNATELTLTGDVEYQATQENRPDWESSKGVVEASGASRLVLDDGLVALASEGAPSLDIDASAVFLESGSVAEMNSGRISIGLEYGPGTSLTLQDATFAMSGGSVSAVATWGSGAAVRAVDSQLTISGGTAHAGSPTGDATAVSLTGSSSGTMVGGHLNAAPYGLLLSDDSTFTFQGGKVTSHGVVEQPGHPVTVRDRAQFQMIGGVLSAEGGSVTGVSATDQAIVSIGGGTIRTERGGARNSSIVMSGNSRLGISGGTLQHQPYTDAFSGGGPAILLTDSSHGGMTGGSIQIEETAAAVLQLDDESTFTLAAGPFAVRGPGDASSMEGARVGGQAELVIESGGLIVESTFFLGIATGVAISDDATVKMRGGQLTAICGPHPARAQGLRTTGNARAEISGGVIEARGEGPDSADLAVVENSLVTLVGSDFNFPMYEPLTPTQGTITGKLLDGTAIDFTFVRGPAATIMLIPEPSSHVLAALALLVLLRARK